MKKKIPILNVLFCHIFPLHDYLQALRIPCVAIDDPSLLSLLQSVVVAFRHNDEIYSSNYNASCEHDTLFIIYRAIEKSCHKKIDNVISQGYSCIREYSKKSCIPGTAYIELNGVENTVVTYLTTKPWKSLHAVIGDDIFFYLLTKSFMFLSVQNECFVQLSGNPLYQLQPKEKCDCLIKQQQQQQHISDILNGKIDEFSGKASIKRKRNFLQGNRKNKRRKIQTVSGSCESKTNNDAPDQKEMKLSRKTCSNTLKHVQRRTLSKAGSSSAAVVKYLSLKRYKIFYSAPSEGISKKYILRKISASNKGVASLIETIFGVTSSDTKRIPRSLIAVKAVLKKLIINFKFKKFKIMLDCHCPYPDWLRKKEKVSYGAAVNCFLPTQKVCWIFTCMYS